MYLALASFSGDKALGPNEFTMDLWKFSWDFMMASFREFHTHSRFVKNLNMAFLALIPKKGGAEELKDFMPISLVGGLYKYLTKVLVNRLKLVLGKLISKVQ